MSNVAINSNLIFGPERSKRNATSFMDWFFQSPSAFLICLTIILAVSIYDTYMVFVFQNIIIGMERNPICLFLIELDPDNLSWFLGGKLLGNLGVVSVLAGLKKFRYRYAQIAAITVAAFQLGLLTYLSLADYQTGVFHFDYLWNSDPRLFNIGVRNALAHAGVLLLAGTIGITVRQLCKTRQNRDRNLFQTS